MAIFLLSLVFVFLFEEAFKFCIFQIDDLTFAAEKYIFLSFSSTHVDIYVTYIIPQIIAVHSRII